MGALLTEVCSVLSYFTFLMLLYCICLGEMALHCEGYYIIKELVSVFSPLYLNVCLRYDLLSKSLNYFIFLSDSSHYVMTFQYCYIYCSLTEQSFTTFINNATCFSPSYGKLSRI